MTKTSADNMRNIINLMEGKNNYEIYHDTMTAAFVEVRKNLANHGYEISDNDFWEHVNTGPRKPAEGNTNKYHIPLMKGSESTNKTVKVQIYGMANKYELNMYI